MNSSSGRRDPNTDDLHGNVPDRSLAVLLLVDVINDLEFPDNEYLVRQSGNLAQSIAALKQRCQQAGIPAIYVNDNFGKWRSDFSEVLKHSSRPEAPGRPMVTALAPKPEDYVVLKPKHSAFYATPLETLLEYLGARTIILSGITTNACIMITAGDLYVRDFRLFVPCDCVAALTEQDQHQALELMRKNFAAQTAKSQQMDLSSICK
jgi:nicotinamidase-related amidase